MDISSVKLDLIHWLTEVNDHKLLEKLQLIKKEQEKSLHLDESQEEELENRLKKYEAGEMKFASWESSKEKIRSKAKNDL